MFVCECERERERERERQREQRGEGERVVGWEKRLDTALGSVFHTVFSFGREDNASLVYFPFRFSLQNSQWNWMLLLVISKEINITQFSWILQKKTKKQQKNPGVIGSRERRDRGERLVQSAFEWNE